MRRGVAQGKKNYYVIFLFLFIFCMYIRNDVNRWTPLFEKSKSATVIII